MKTVIVYGSKKDFTKDMAYELKDKIHADVINVKDKDNLKLDGYDLVIVGTPLYMGRILKSISKFIDKNMNDLKQKKLAFFITGIGEPKEMTGLFETQIKPELFEHAEMVSHFGGELRPDKSRFLVKAIVKRMALDDSMTKVKNNEEINMFVHKMKEITG